MNFCKKIDKYISLYLDELLDDKVKTEFLKHIYECNQCSSKFKEASYVADLCRENEDIQLPDNFSSSLHERLMEVDGNKSENKIWTFVHNKRFIASLSTAAVLVVSLLAYNSLPHRGSLESTSMANDTLQVETSSTVNNGSGSSENKSAILSKDTVESASSDEIMSNNVSSNNTTADSTPSKEAGIQTESMPTTQSKPAAQNYDVTVTFNKPVSTEEENNSQQVSKYQSKEATSSSNKDSEKKQEIDASCYTLKSKNQADTNEYSSNYAELNLKVSNEGLEIENLRKLMNEVCAIELKPVTINNAVQNSAESSTESSAESSTENIDEASVESPQYVDYYLPLSSYSTLKSQATNYTLELSTKTDIINNDTTDKYNTLNTQKSGIDRKIADALKNGENAADLENEKTKITGEINKLISEKEMITVRVYFTP